MLDLFRHYQWPGNVRELENALEHAVAVSQDQTIKVEDLPQEIRDAWTHERGEESPMPSVRVPGIEPLSDSSRSVPPAEAPGGEASALLEIDQVRAALETHRWSRARAAKALGISRTTLWRKMREFGLT